MTESIKFGNLTINIDGNSDQTTLTFKGDVDENFRQEKVPRIDAAKIIFELSGIENFNSCGIREWIYLIKDFSALAEIEFVNCSVTMIDQINMVPDSIGSASISSFYAPYFCEGDNCAGEVSRSINVEEHKEALSEKTAPNFKCKTCNQNLEFDALEESYFIFLENNDLITKAS